MRYTLFVGCILLLLTTSGMRPANGQEVEPQTYLSRAIAILKARHINSHLAEWPAIETEARRLSSAAVTPADTYPAIQYVIAALGERHSYLITAEAAKRMMEGRNARTGDKTPLAVPSVSMDSGIATVTIPAFMGDIPRQTLFAAEGRKAMANADALGVCGWIVDLRENTGGNMWPMVNALSGILGTPPFGAFVSPDGTTSSWTMKSGEVLPSRTTPSLGLPIYNLASADRPVVVLIGPRTASSGEFTAMALRGRPHTVIAGEPSAGLVTANALITLSDGALLAVTTGWGQDRKGKRDVGKIQPDLHTNAPIPASKNWLESEGCAARSNNAAVELILTEYSLTE